MTASSRSVSYCLGTGSLSARQGLQGPRVSGGDTRPPWALSAFTQNGQVQPFLWCRKSSFRPSAAVPTKGFCVWRLSPAWGPPPAVGHKSRGEGRLLQEEQDKTTDGVCRAPNSTQPRPGWVRARAKIADKENGRCPWEASYRGRTSYPNHDDYYSQHLLSTYYRTDTSSTIVHLMSMLGGLRPPPSHPGSVPLLLDPLWPAPFALSGFTGRVGQGWGDTSRRSGRVEGRADISPGLLPCCPP